MKCQSCHTNKSSWNAEVKIYAINFDESTDLLEVQQLCFRCAERRGLVKNNIKIPELDRCEIAGCGWNALKYVDDVKVCNIHKHKEYYQDRQKARVWQLIKRQPDAERKIYVIPSRSFSYTWFR